MSEWITWSPCSASCGMGSRSRERYVKQFPDDGSICTLPTEETEDCVVNEECCEFSCFASASLWSKCISYGGPEGTWVRRKKKWWGGEHTFVRSRRSKCVLFYPHHPSIFFPPTSLRELRNKYNRTITEPWLYFRGLSSQQLPGYRVGWMGCLQRHLWSRHEEEGALGEDASCWWLYLRSRGVGGGEVHDARMP